MSNVEAPVDKHGFTQKPPMTDLEVIIRCLGNAPCGVDEKHAARIAAELKARGVLG